MQTKLFRRDFTLVVIGQIISLFGNAILRFALPLYLLRETGSSTLFGVVTACSFAPMVILSMVGGVLADRVNKRNIMVGLDFSSSSHPAGTASWKAAPWPSATIHGSAGDDYSLPYSRGFFQSERPPLTSLLPVLRA